MISCHSQSAPHAGDHDNFDLDGDPESDLEQLNIEADKYGKKKKKKEATISMLRKIVAIVSIVGAVVVLIMSVDFRFSTIKSWFHSAPMHDAFDLIESQTIKEFNAKLHLYRHKKTQAEFLSFIFKDKEESEREDKAFGISFRTVPNNNKGTAHILEHSVLQGSHKYPVKDPFLHMRKSSLNTYLNAMTYNDRTVYPIASRNSADYLNLLKVYLDAVFYPLCVETRGRWIFQQEGWRYELADDNSGDFEYKGVVYSEMKGVYSNPISVLERESQKALFPDNTYHYDSGGDPLEIPTLTPSEFTHFYRYFYHPSNAQIFASGTHEDVLAAMEAVGSILKNFEPNEDIRSSTNIPYQKKTFQTPEYIRLPFVATSKEKNKLEAEKGQGLVSLTWLLNEEEMDTYTDLRFSVLEQLLLGTDSSPLKKALDRSNLGDSVIDIGYDNYLLQATFSVGLKDVSATAWSDFNKLVMTTLQDIFDNGFSTENIKAAVNNLEFQLRQFDTGSQPKSIIIFLSILDKWNYDFHPKTALEYESDLTQLKDDIESRGSAIFQDLIKTYLLDNNHRVLLELLPSETFEEEQLKEEKDRLAEFRKSLSDDKYQEIVYGLEEFKKIQETPDSPHDIGSLPQLSMKDIENKVELYPLEVVENAYSKGVTVLKHEVSSSKGILYADFGLDVSNVSYDDIELLPLICSLMESGTKNLPEDELNRAIGINTGGISVSLSFEPVLPSQYESPHVSSGNNFKTMLFISGKSTVDKASELFDLVAKMIFDADFDKKEKVAILFNKELSLLKISVPSSGHSYANMRVKSRYNPLSYINEMLNGVTSFERLEQLQKQLDEDWEGLLARLQNVLQIILTTSSESMVLNLTSDSKGLKSVESHVNNFVSTQLQIPNGNPLPVPDYRQIDHPWASEARKHMDNFSMMKNEAVVVLTQVSYVGVGGLLWNPGDAIGGSAEVVSGYLKNGYLWDTVRVKNGAYGAKAALSLTDGLYVMLSYRDPNLGKTIDAFKAAGEALSTDTKSVDLTPIDVNNAIIGAIGSLDGPALTPHQIGWKSYLEYATGKDSKYRQQWRTDIISTRKADFVDFASRLAHWRKSSVAVISSQEAVREYKNSTYEMIDIIDLT